MLLMYRALLTIAIKCIMGKRQAFQVLEFGVCIFSTLLKSFINLRENYIAKTTTQVLSMTLGEKINCQFEIKIYSMLRKLIFSV